MSTSGQPVAPGTYKFTVKSADQAVVVIREKLGPNARVLSVRFGVDGAAPSIAPSRVNPLGLTGLLRKSGITETALNRLQAGANWNDLNTLPLHRALAETSRLLRQQVETRTARPPLSRAAFLG